MSRLVVVAHLNAVLLRNDNPFIGFLFVFSAQVILFLVLNMAIELGITSKSGLHFGTAIGISLAIPSFMNALVNALAFASYFVHDAWRGHRLMSQFLNHPLHMQWVVFLFYLGFPLLTMGVTLLLRFSQWWEMTSLVWFYCTFMFYVCFVILVVFYETLGCWEIMKNREQGPTSPWQLLRMCILARQFQTYSGEQYATYLSQRNLSSALDNTELENTRREWKGLWTYVTLLPALSTDQGLGLMEHLADPEALRTMADARDVRPFVTSTTWSLQKSFCGWPHHAGQFALVRGPGALTRSQQRSSLAGAVVGDLLVILLVTGALFWLNAPVAGTIAFVVIMAAVLCARFRRNYRVYRATQELQSTYEEDGLADEEPSVVVHSVLVRNRITRPTELFCWVMFTLEVSVFFLWPLSALLRVGSASLGVLFVVVVGMSALRYYVNASVILEDKGNLDLLDGKAGSIERWQNQSRLNKIVGGIAHGRSRFVWAILLGFFSLLFLGFGLAGFSQNHIVAADLEYSLLPDFYYQAKADLAYPTCRIGSGLRSTAAFSLADYCFLSNVAYREEAVTQSQLDSWFGKNVAVDKQSTVDEFRNRTDGFRLDLSFKMVAFPSKNTTIVAIRGTTKVSDFLTDAQLWSAAAFLQLARALLPAGRIWTPILYHLASIIAAMESRGLGRVSFYQTTTAFVKELLDDTAAGDIQLTGHSLGGGLSIITGAQTNVVAVAVSAPNALISRRTFDPPLTVDSLNSFTFNIVPEHDPVAMVDDRAELFQEIKCRAPFNHLMACHDPIRSLCEILYTCGTGNRPALCECATQYGFPIPTSRGNRTFEEACRSPT